LEEQSDENMKQNVPDQVVHHFGNNYNNSTIKVEPKVSTAEAQAPKLAEGKSPEADQIIYHYGDNYNNCTINGKTVSLCDKCKDISDECVNINFIHDKEERKNLLDGTGEGFPVPPGADQYTPKRRNLQQIQKLG